MPAPLAVAVLAGLALSVPSSDMVKPPAGTPDLAKMALRASDLPPGAKVKRQGYVEAASFARYEREFTSRTARVGGKRLLGLVNDLFLERAAATAADEFTQLRQLVETKRGRQAIVDALEDALGFEPDVVRVSRPFGFGVGQESVGLTFTIGTFLGTFQAVVGYFRVDRIVADVVLEGSTGARLGRGDLSRLARPVGARMTAGLLPTASVLPVVRGSPAAGQLLTASGGTWRNRPVSLAYRWQRCDGAGVCADITGATSSEYVLLDDDDGSTVRVEVTATNGVGSTTSFSAPTAVVAPLAGAPVNVVPPSVTGTAGQGQTLTAAPGTWVGRPSALAYQWQRCDATGAGCLSIDGATLATHVVAPADAGMTLRVAVTATNASGSTTVVSPATAAVT